MNELHLFAGAGGGILGGMLLGHRPVCAVEIKPFKRACLLQRQRDGLLPWFPIWDDVRTFDGTPWNGKVDAVCGGFPCQDISFANNRPAGLDGERSGLWSQMFRVVCEVRPKFVFVENSPALLIRGFGRVLRDLAEAGYHGIWGVFSGRNVGAPILRERVFLLASSYGIRWNCLGANLKNRRSDINPQSFDEWQHLQAELQIPVGLAYDTPMRGVLRNDNGLAEGVDRLEAIGDGQVPAVVKLAWETLSQ